MYGSIEIAEKEILSIEFNDKGNELYLRHDNGFDIYQLTVGGTDIEKLINEINQVKTPLIAKKL